MNLRAKSWCWVGLMALAAGCSSGGSGDDDDDSGGESGAGGSGGSSASGGTDNGGTSGSSGKGGSGATGGCECTGLDVCDTSTGTCVECVRSGDCTGTDVCIDQTCVSPDSCSGPSDCTGGLYCDVGAAACVECLMDSHCGVGETCAQSSCVPEDTGTGGTSGTGGTDSGTGGTAGAEDGTGGTNGGTGGSTGGTGADGGTSGTGGTGGSNGGTGGNECTCSGSEECTVQGDCVDPDTIEDFAECDDTIIQVRGRSGTWYADGDTGINVMFGIGNPGSAWSDNSCAAWTVGGPTGSGSATWGVMGVDLNEGSAYDLSDYSGISVRVETGAGLGVNITTTDGGNFQAQIGPTTGSQTFNLSFGSDFHARPDSAVSNMNLAKIKGIQFTPDSVAEGYGLAVHALFLN